MPQDPTVLLKNWLRNEYNIRVEDDWISGCVTFFQQENPRITNQQLKQSAYEQWLLANLTEMALPTYNTRLTHSIQTINGKFALQLQYILDVSEPAYEQLRKIENKQLDEVQEATDVKTQPVKKKRMFKLELTDGHTTISAMEYQPIKALNSKLTPGIKILLIGPIRCVEKVLLLESKNVKILGGEVDILLICNAYENVLLKCIGKPLNATPNKNYEEATVSEHFKKKPLPQKPNRTTQPKPPQPPPSTVQKDNFDFDDFDDFDFDLDAISRQATCPVVTTKTSVAVQHCSKPTNNQQRVLHPKADEMDFDFDDDMEMLNAIEEDIRQENRINSSSAIVETVVTAGTSKSNSQFSVTSSKPNTQKYENMSIDYDNDVEMSPAVVDSSMANLAAEFMDDDWIPSTPPMSHNKTTEISAKIECKSSAAPINSGPPVAKVQPIRRLPILEKTYKFKIEGINLVTIDQLAECSFDEQVDKKFMLFAEIESLTQILKIKKGEWHLHANVTDQSEQLLTVKVHNDIMAELSGFEATELEEMRKEFKARPQLKCEVNDILEALKTKLEELHCFMQIRIATKDTVYLERTIEVKPVYKIILKNKIEKENLVKLRQVVVS